MLAEAPTADVIIPISSSDTTEGGVSSASLTFTTGNWNVAQIVTVTGMDDSQPDGDIGFTVITGNPTSADPGYNALTAASVADVAFTNTDNDRVQSNLLALYTFEENGGATVNDVTASPLDLTIADLPNVIWSPGYVTVTADTIISSGVAATKIITGAQATNALTVEAWVKASATIHPDGAPHRLVTVSANTGERNFTLLQHDADEGPPASAYGARLRASAADLNGVTPSPFTPAGDATTNLDHVVFTHDAAGNETIYVNGVVRYTGSRPGNFSSWDASYALALVNEFTRDRDWLGEMHLAAIYGRALSASEVQRNFAAGADVHTLIVDTVSDVADGDTASIESLLNDRGADGFISLREAILATNNTANAATPDRIHFNIAGTGPHTINLTSALPVISDSVILDGTTEPDYAGTNPVIVIDGNNIAGVGLTLAANADGSVIRGFVIRDFDGGGANGIGILIQAGSDNNVIVGNYIGRLNADGTAAPAADVNNQDGIQVLGATNTIGGTTAQERNVISGNGQYGIWLNGEAADGNIVRGNYIGVAGNGTTALGNGNDAIMIDSGDNNTIGGTATGSRNVIAGNTGDGVHFAGSAQGNVVQGNWIGQNGAGNALGNQDGIELNGATAAGNTIGGTAPGAGNVIRGNSQNGIEISNNGADQNQIRGNSIYGNTILGIDLNKTANALDANDVGDGDAQGNQSQNYPVINNAYVSAGFLTITGQLNSRINSTYRSTFSRTLPPPRAARGARTSARPPS